MKESKILNSLICDQLGGGIKFIFAWLYVVFTKLELHCEIGEGEIILFFTQERIKRKDYFDFLNRLVSEGSNIKLQIYRRKFSIRNIVNLNYKKSIIRNAEDVSSDIMRVAKSVVIFCPHYYFSYLVLMMIRRNSTIKVGCLQHGYYSFQSEKYRIYKEATRCDYAFIYNEKYIDFFENCKKKYVIGDYMSPTRDNKPDMISGTVFYLTLISDSSFSEVLSCIKKLSSISGYNYLIFHPAQDYKISKKIIKILNQDRNFITTKRWLCGDVNYFYKTTAHKKIIFEKNKKYILIDNGCSIKEIDPFDEGKVITKLYDELCKSLCEQDFE